MLLQQSSPAETATFTDKLHRSASESCLTTSTCDSVDAPSDNDDDEDLLLHPISEIATSETEEQTQTQRRRTMPKRKSSIRSFDADSIPIRNRGWKNLPKVQSSPSLGTKHVVEQRRSSVSHKVSFENIEFRCFEQCAGDNPSVSIGTPVALDWDFVDMEPIALEDYESSRDGARRTPRQLMMNYFQRRTLLSYRYGCSEEELNAAEKAANRIRNQRAVTRALLPASLLEDFMTSAARKTKRVLGKQRDIDGIRDTAPVERSSTPPKVTATTAPESLSSPTDTDTAETFSDGFDNEEMEV